MGESGHTGPVLIVVADAATSGGLSNVLETGGFEVLTASGESDANAMDEARRPRAIIVDALLEGGRGADVARRLKGKDPTSAVLLLTGSASLGEALPVVPELDGLLVKPLVRQVFLQSVRNALAIRGLAEENRRLATRFSELSGNGRVEPPAHDVLDRPLFSRSLDTAISQSQNQQSPMAVVVAELGGWQDAAGRSSPQSSDDAIALLTKRLVDGRRKSDLVGRIALDRFAVACSDVRSSADCHRIVRIVLESLEGPVPLNGKEHWLAPRAGVVLTDPSSPGQSADSVMNEAETALECARNEGRAWKLFDKSILDQALAREGVSMRIRQAMDTGELTLVYEPVTELESSRVIGAAVCLYWIGPDGPSLVSSEFLARGGDIAVSAQVARWMLDRAFSDLAAWREAHQVQEDFRLAIGVSSRDVADPQFAETVEEQIAKHSISPGMVSFDLSGAAARQATSSGFALAHLSEAGVLFNLDDFGSSEISLASLSELPLNALKIDASLVGGLDSRDGSHHTALMRGLISLGQEMRLAVIAKGVRTSEQRTALLAMGCKLAQHSSSDDHGGPGRSTEAVE